MTFRLWRCLKFHYQKKKKLGHPNCWKGGGLRILELFQKLNFFMPHLEAPGVTIRPGVNRPQALYQLVSPDMASFLVLD